MSLVLSIVNQKGGSTKTSTAVNLACAIAATRRRVLLIDLDAQGSATVALSLDRADSDKCLAGSLIADNDIVDTIVHYEQGQFDVIPSSDDLIAVQVAIYNEDDRTQKLNKHLELIKDDYDLIIIDTPPSLNLLTENAMCASDYILIPMPCEYFALDSLLTFLDVYNGLKREGLSKAKLLGIVRTLYEEERPLSKEIHDELEKHFDDLLFKTVIPFSSSIIECTSIGRPVMFYDKSSNGARSYLNLAGEVLQKLNI